MPQHLIEKLKNTPAHVVAENPENVDHERYFVRDGIVIIPKDAVIPHGTVI